ncbi:MAG: amino acid adenylation domain-containing protein, partial [Bacteroidota bacterium]
AYNMPMIEHFDNKLDLDRLRNTFLKLMSRHEILRTTFHLIDGEPFQKVHPQVELFVEHFQTTSEELTNTFRSFTRPFDLTRGPLFRIGVVDVAGRGNFLLFDIHHIISDGLSHQLMIKEFMTLYQGGRLPELQLQYKDYAEWQQSEGQQKELERQKSFWLSQFEDEPDSLDLPLDHARRLDGNLAADVCELSLSKEKTQQLRAYASRQGATMFMLGISFYYILLSKLCRIEDIVIGTPVAGREHAELEGIVGLFVNTLPLRQQLKGQESYREFLNRVRENLLACFDNQAFPYEELVDALKLDRNSNRNPLFDVMYAAENFVAADHKEKAKNVKLENTTGAAAKFDLALTSKESEGHLVLMFEYATNLFEAETIERFARYYEGIVDTVLANDQIRIADIEIISREEKHQILREFNRPATALPTTSTVLEHIENQARQRGDALAVVAGNAKLTYAELNAMANQLARQLRADKGVQTGDLVGIYQSRSIPMLVSILAVLKAGAAFVPIDGEYNPKRVQQILAEAKPRVVLTDLADALLAIDPTVNLLDLYLSQQIIESQSKEDLQLPIQGNDLAYVLFTSGSTGKPKGILIEHLSLLDYTLTFVDYFSLTAEDGVIQQASLSFDTAVEEIFTTLSVGAVLHIMPERGRDANAIVDAIKWGGASVLSTTPLVLNELNKRAEELTNLRLVISGGELLLPSHVDRIVQQTPLYNTYGPSESTVCISYHKVDKLEDASCLGRPIANRQVFITDRYGALCPPSVAGELCVSGRGLARAYLNNESLTKEKFIDNPFVEGERMYKTGDLARWRSNGEIEFLGRIDKQVKLRGMRIELGEIEYRLSEHPNIREAAVIVKVLEGEKYLTAYCVSDNELDVSAIRKFLSESLPSYMLPSYFLRLDALPITTNGKLAIRKLPDPVIDAGNDYLAPSSEIEKKLVAIWADVLQLPENKISINRNFFELGGHSLKAIGVTSKIEKEFNVRIKLQTFFQEPTIEDLQKSILMHSIISRADESSNNIKVTI